MHRAFGKGLKGAVFRPGMLWGSSKTGALKTVCVAYVVMKEGMACLFEVGHRKSSRHAICIRRYYMISY